MPLAQACVLSGDDRAAAEILRGTFSLERPGWDEVRKAEMYYRAQAAIGDKESAVSAIEKALRDYPDDPRLLALESVRCGILDDLDGAEEPLLKALDCSEEADQREIQIRLGILYQNQGRFSEAADKFNGMLTATSPTQLRFLYSCPLSMASDSERHSNGRERFVSSTPSHIGSHWRSRPTFLTMLETYPKR